MKTLVKILNSLFTFLTIVACSSAPTNYQPNHKRLITSSQVESESVLTVSIDNKIFNSFKISQKDSTIDRNLIVRVTVTDAGGNKYEETLYEDHLTASFSTLMPGAAQIQGVAKFSAQGMVGLSSTSVEIKPNQPSFVELNIYLENTSSPETYKYLTENGIWVDSTLPQPTDTTESRGIGLLLDIPQSHSQNFPDKIFVSANFHGEIYQKEITLQDGKKEITLQDGKRVSVIFNSAPATTPTSVQMTYLDGTPLHVDITDRFIPSNSYTESDNYETGSLSVQVTVVTQPATYEIATPKNTNNNASLRVIYPSEGAVLIKGEKIKINVNVQNYSGLIRIHLWKNGKFYRSLVPEVLAKNAHAVEYTLDKDIPDGFYYIGVSAFDETPFSAQNPSYNFGGEFFIISLKNSNISNQLPNELRNCSQSNNCRNVKSFVGGENARIVPAQTGKGASLYVQIDNSSDFAGVYLLGEGIKKAWDEIGAESSVIGLPISQENYISSSETDENIRNIVNAAYEEDAALLKENGINCIGTPSWFPQSQVTQLLKKDLSQGTRVIFEDGRIDWYRNTHSLNPNVVYDLWFVYSSQESTESPELIDSSHVYEIGLEPATDLPLVARKPISIGCAGKSPVTLSRSLAEKKLKHEHVTTEVATLLMDDFIAAIDSDNSIGNRIFNGLSFGSNFVDGVGFVAKVPLIAQTSKLIIRSKPARAFNQAAVIAGRRFATESTKILAKTDIRFINILENTVAVFGEGNTIRKSIYINRYGNNGKRISYSRTYIPDAVKGNTLVEFKDRMKISLNDQLRAMVEISKSQPIEIIISKKPNTFSSGAKKIICDAIKFEKAKFQIHRFDKDSKNLDYDVTKQMLECGSK